MKQVFKIQALVVMLCVLLSPAVLASGEASGGMAPPPGGGGGGSAPTSYDAVLDITTDQTLNGVSMESVNGDENIIHVMNGATAWVTNSNFANGGTGSGGDASSFYGVGATLFVSDGTLYAQNDVINTDTTGGAGVFAYKDGTAYVSGLHISTNAGSSGGLHVAGGGTLYAWDCDVVTQAPMAAAAIRSDRGGGTMVIDGGSYVTSGGTGAVYVTADISVHNAYLYTGSSEAIAIEGKNTLRLFDCTLEGNMIPSAINDNKVWNIIVYQSMSGDAETGTSHFEMAGGKLTAHAGPIVYNTNTSSYITFRDVDIVRNDDTTCFLQVTGNSSSRTWGRAGANGANCIFTAYAQTLPGDIVYDSISDLDMYLLDGSVLNGAILIDDSRNGGYSGDGGMDLTIGPDAVWNVTGPSVINGTLACAGTVTNATIKDFSGNFLWGSGPYTVYVRALTGTVDFSGAGTLHDWAEFAVDNPFTSVPEGTSIASGEASAAPSAASGEASTAPSAASGEASAAPSAASGESVAQETYPLFEEYKAYLLSTLLLDPFWQGNEATLQADIAAAQTPYDANIQNFTGSASVDQAPAGVVFPMTYDVWYAANSGSPAASSAVSSGSGEASGPAS